METLKYSIIKNEKQYNNYCNTLEGLLVQDKKELTDEIEFVRLAQKHRILLVPGSGFGAPGYFRIAYCTEDDIIERSLPAWEKLAKEVGL